MPCALGWALAPFASPKWVPFAQECLAAHSANDTAIRRFSSCCGYCVCPACCVCLHGCNFHYRRVVLLSRKQFCLSYLKKNFTKEQLKDKMLCRCDSNSSSSVSHCGHARSEEKKREKSFNIETYRSHVSNIAWRSCTFLSASVRSRGSQLRPKALPSVLDWKSSCCCWHTLKVRTSRSFRMRKTLVAAKLLVKVVV